MKATMTAKFEVFNDTTKEKVAKGEFTIEYDTDWWKEAAHDMATEKCHQLAELFWKGEPTWCMVTCEDGWTTDYVNDEN